MVNIIGTCNLDWTDTEGLYPKSNPSKSNNTKTASALFEGCTSWTGEITEALTPTHPLQPLWHVKNYELTFSPSLNRVCVRQKRHERRRGVSNWTLVIIRKPVCGLLLVEFTPSMTKYRVGAPWWTEVYWRWTGQQKMAEQRLHVNFLLCLHIQTNTTQIKVQRTWKYKPLWRNNCLDIV